MKLRVEGKIYDFTSKTTSYQNEILKRWSKTGRNSIECMCIEGRSNHPLMHIRKTKSKNGSIKYSLVNNRKSKSFHYNTCVNNQSQMDYLRNKGISSVNGKLKFKYSTGEGEVNAWEQLFLSLIQITECSLDVYKHGQKRSISSRLYKAASLCEIDGMKLIDEGQFNIQVISDSPKKTVIRNGGTSPRLIIAWGEIDCMCENHPKFDYLCKLPLYSVDDIEKHVCDITLKKSLIEKAKKEAPANVKQGWWIIWREVNKKGNMEVKEIVFIAAEQMTRIPVSSIYEEKLIQELVKLKRDFKKPLLWNIETQGNNLNPNLILINNNKYVIVEVIESIGALYKLNTTEKLYRELGFDFTEWRAYDTSHKLSILKLEDK